MILLFLDFWGLCAEKLIYEWLFVNTKLVFGPLANQHPDSTEIDSLLIGDVQVGIVNELTNVQVPSTSPLFESFLGTEI